MVISSVEGVPKAACLPQFWGLSTSQSSSVWRGAICTRDDLRCPFSIFSGSLFLSSTQRIKSQAPAAPAPGNPRWLLPFQASDHSLHPSTGCFWEQILSFACLQIPEGCSHPSAQEWLFVGAEFLEVTGGEMLKKIEKGRL